jgi:hypothetical protein
MIEAVVVHDWTEEFSVGNPLPCHRSSTRDFWENSHGSATQEAKAQDRGDQGRFDRTTAMTGPRYGAQRWWRLIGGVFALALVTPGAGLAAEHVPNALILPSLETDRAAGYAVEPVSAAPVSPEVEAEWGTGSGKSYLIPALEIPAFMWLLNRYDRAVYGNDVYGTNWNTGWQHVIHGPWELDTDPFAMNMIMHPYVGSIYFGFARSAGLNYWESLGYTFAASFVWETYGETGPPSTNDQIMTGIGGSFLGEALFRMASMVLEGNDKPGFWRELGAAGLSPSTGFNRFAFGNRFKAVWVSNEPAIFTRLRLGASLNSHVTDQGVKSTVEKVEATGDFSLSYGLPGKPGYQYERPFDYFHFEFTIVGSGGNSFENVMTRGLLIGKKYSAGNDTYRGVWGLYGSYDYISPEVFRVASTALSVGTTAQWWLARAVALQGSVLGGAGFGAAGTIAAVGSPAVGERDYHFGAVPQGLLALRVIFGEAAMLDLTGREYYVSGVGSDDRHGSERIFRGNASFTVRVYGRHALGIQYVQSRRNAYYADLPNRHQMVETISIAYNFLGDTKFGAVEWRNFSADRR